MKKYILLFLVLTSVSSAQFPMLAAWQSSAVAFTPASIDSLKGWYVAADIADSLGKSTGDTTYIWKNRARFLSPMAMNDMFQTTSARKPVYRDSAGARFLQFDGVDDGIHAASIPRLVQPNTVFFVQSTYKATNAQQRIITAASGGVFSDIFWNTSVTGFPIVCFAGSVLSGNTLVGDSVRIWRYEANGASSLLAANGTLRAAGNLGTGYMAAFGVGSLADASQPMNGKFYEVIVYHRILTAPEISSVQSYLATKYGITLL